LRNPTNIPLHLLTQETEEKKKTVRKSLRGARSVYRFALIVSREAEHSVKNQHNRKFFTLSSTTKYGPDT